MQPGLMFAPSADNAFAISAGLLVLRLVLGPVMAAHGAQKLLGWFGGYGLTGTAGFFEQIGFRPGRVFAAVAAGAEVVSGLLIALGLLGPVGPALLLAVVIVAGVSVHWRHGLFAQANGIELTLVYAAAAFALAFTGPGLFSLDTLLGIEMLSTWPLILGTLSLGVAAGIANLIARRPAASAAGSVTNAR